MLNTRQLKEEADRGTLYEALRGNLREVCDELEKGEPLDPEKESEWLGGIAATIGFTMVDVAESLDRIADSVDPHERD